MNEEKCVRCGYPLDLTGTCINEKCKAQHTVINTLPDDSLTDCQYKDFYG